MRIAIRDNEIYKEDMWNKHFINDVVNESGEVICFKLDLTKHPYNYQILNINDDYCDNISYCDFKCKNGVYYFDEECYLDRQIKESEIIKNAEYKTKIRALISERYSFADEIAIIRQRDAKPDEYKEYYNYCEHCKSLAAELSIY